MGRARSSRPCPRDAAAGVVGIFAKPIRRHRLGCDPADFLSAYFAIDLRVLRLPRVLRILKLTRYSPALGTMAAVARKESRAILGALCFLIVIVMIASTAIHLLEAPGQPEIFGTIPDAMWWSIETLTTVGYGDAIPQAAAGRVVGAIVMLLGIGVFVLWTSIFAAGFLEESRKEGFVVTWQLVARVPVFARLDAARSLRT